MKREQTPLILVFSTAYLPYIGGAEIAIHEIARRAEKLRFLIITSRFSRGLPKYEESGNMIIRRVGFGTKFDKWLLPIAGYIAGKKALRRNKNVLLWGVMISQGALAAYFLKKRYPKTPLIITLQEGDSEEYLSKGRLGLINYFWRRILARADGVTAISEYLASRARTRGYRGDISIIPNGVDEKYFGARRTVSRIKAQELGISDTEKIILSVSRLVPKNGVVELLHAFYILHQRNRAMRLLYIGDGSERALLEERARAWNLGRAVLFLGALPHEELISYYAMSDIFARPSRSEGLGSAFLEAMGAGVPVVATPVGGIVDFLKDHETGILVKPGDPESIANGIEELLAGSPLREKIIKNARALVIEKYLWVDIAKKMESILLAACA